MSTFTVTAVHKEISLDRSHRHIAGVYTANGTYFPRSAVVTSIEGGTDTWATSSGGYTAPIHVVRRCHLGTGCAAIPYIATKPDSTKADNLENLPER